MAKLVDFEGFRFGNIHSSDLNLVVVSQNNRYDKNVLPSPSDYSSNIPGGDGKYYFGQTFNTREFTVNVAFNNVSEDNFRQISQLFATDKLQDLVFDEMPFKTFKAKIKSKPDFRHVCFTDANGKRVYKGEGTIQFICYFPYAFGFNKYVVRAADYYKCMLPEDIIFNSINENPYEKRRPKILPGLIKDHYNVRPNMNTPWKGGYPTIEQTQWGELYFKEPPSNESPVMPQDCMTSESPNGAKLLIDVRGYWKNIPEWQDTAKLLTTPTLDYDRELIFMPQYNKVNFINMETGLNNEQGLIGSRILVYNPGDIAIDFEIKLDNLRKHFRGNDGAYDFRISRYNVERLSIEEAVDYTGMETVDKTEDGNFKYGNRYFKILEPDGKGGVGYRNLKNAHPKHCYIVEPIPKEKLAEYIKLFYWQSFQLELITEHEWRVGIDMANRYQEMYDNCINDAERYEVYWQTLKDAILAKYGEYEYPNDEAARKQFVADLTETYFGCPPEYIKINKEWEEEFGREYGNIDFNLSRLPIYITEDYLEINSEELFADEDKDVKSLFLDSEKRMLYNINEPEWKNNKPWLQDNIEKKNNFYDFKPSKNIYNEAIEEGQWFKIPPGWSLISIDPVVDENRWGGKLWEDAKPFKWGETDHDKREEFYTIYYMAMRDYLAANCPQPILDKLNNGHYPVWANLTNEELETYGQFRRWYGEDEDTYGDFNQEANTLNPAIKNHNLHYSLIRKKNEDAEYGFLKLLASYWNILHTNSEGKITSTIEDWWWEASNYMWANFPPLYWGYMDLLNQITIKYVPLFY